MRARLLKYWNDIRSSYWFIPTLMCLSAAVLAGVLTRMDLVFGSAWLEDADILLTVRPSGARAVLSTIAGSVIGVAGVTFSVTIAAVAYATGQYGPRLLGNFMRDRGNQVTLGTFLATFLYSLLILHTIRDANESMASGPGGQTVAVGFVPLIALAAALAFALCSVAVLIYFIHHIPESIHIANVVAKIGRELRAEVETLFPAHLGNADRADADSPAADGRLPNALTERADEVRAEGSGYIQNLDADGLLKLATDHDLTIQLLVGPGAFISPGTLLARAWPPERVSASTRSSIRGIFAWGNQRTPFQNPRFLADELVEIAARALSPGINDPFTATNCLDWLGDALGHAATRQTPIGLRRDAAGEIRLLAPPLTFEALTDRVFGQLRPYVRADRNAALHAFEVLRRVSRRVEPGSDLRKVLGHHADALLEGCRETLSQPLDLSEVEEAHEVTIRLIHDRADSAWPLRR